MDLIQLLKKLNNVERQLFKEMKNSVEAFSNELKNIRTGRYLQIF